MEDDLNHAVNDIITQLKGNDKIVKAMEEEDIDIRNIEEFLIKKSSKLINKSLNIVDNVDDYIKSAPENRDVAAMAELIKAASASIETLNKLHTAKERNETQLEVKKIDVESKERLNLIDNQARILLSREDILNALTDEPGENVIDV
jgi:flavoprotein